MKTTVTLKIDGSVELHHQGKLITFYNVSSAVTYMSDRLIIEDEIITE